MWNKIFAALLIALLTGTVARLVSEGVFHVEPLKEPAYPVVEAEPQAVSTKGPVIEDVKPLLASADVEKGKLLSKKCSTCHSFNKGGANKVGPNLWNVVNAKQGAKGDYGYSAAFGKLGGQWTYDNLNEFLYKPRAYAKGTKMAYAGLKKVKDRAAIIAYLRSLSPKPAPLP